MIYGYARVSTAGQAVKGNSLEDQCEQLREAGAREIYSEHFTGTKMERPEFEKLCEVLKPGDTLIVTKLDRFARNASDGYNKIKEMLDRGVKVHILNMGLVEDTPMGRLMLHMMLAYAEFERDMICERTQAGKAVARQREGWREGRKPLEERVLEQIREGKTWQEIGISRSSWYKYRKEMAN
jgi:DNA invertase Pin-like site-specific DNA recombinase